eukprot:scaffold124796_cov48-Phaeocystis_antarctica.AAC.1
MSVMLGSASSQHGFGPLEAMAHFFNPVSDGTPKASTPVARKVAETRRMSFIAWGQRGSCSVRNFGSSLQPKCLLPGGENKPPDSDVLSSAAAAAGARWRGGGGVGAVAAAAVGQVQHQHDEA